MVRRIIAATAVAFLLVAGVSMPSKAISMQGKSWVSANNGTVGVQQTVMVKAPALRCSAVISAVPHFIIPESHSFFPDINTPPE